MIRKLLRFFFWFFALFASAVVLVLLALNLSTSFQRFVGEQMSAQFHKSGVDLTIERVRVSLPLKLNLYNIHLLDFDQDSLLHVNEAAINLSTFRLADAKFYLNSVDFKQLHVFLTEDSLGETWNVEEFVEQINRRFGGDSPDYAPYIWVDDLSVEDIHVSVKTTNRSAAWPNHLNIELLRLKNSFWEPQNANILTSIDGYQDNLKNSINGLSFQLLFQKNTLGIKDFLLSGEKSQVQMSELSYAQDRSDSIAQLVLNLENAEIHVAEFPSLNKEFGEIGQIKFQAKAKGSTNQLAIENVYLAIDNSSYINLKGDLTDVTSLENCFADVYVDKSLIRSRDVLKLPAANKMTAESDALINRLKDIDFTGELLGYVNDFVAYGTFKSSLGTVFTDISLNTRDTVADFSGSVKTNDFELGTFLNQKAFGKAGLVLELDGNGSNAKNFRAQANGLVPYLEIQNQVLENIELDAIISPFKLNGLVQLKDSVTQIEAEGELNWSTAIPSYSMDFKLEESNIRRFIITTKNSLGISLEAHLEGEGFAYESINSVLNIKRLTFIDSLQTQNFDNTVLSFYNSPLGKEFRLTSSFINANADGNLRPEKLASSFLSILPQNPWLPDNRSGEQDFSYAINVVDNFPIQWLSASSVFVANGSFLSANWKTSENSYSAVIQSDSVFYKDVALQNANIFLEGTRTDFSADMYAKIISRQSVYLKDFQVNVKRIDSIGSWNLSAYNDFSNHFDALGNFTVNKDSMLFGLNDLTGKLAGEAVELLQIAQIQLDTSFLSLRNFKSTLGSHPLELDMLYSLNDGFKSLDFTAEDFDLHTINDLGMNEVILFGTGNINVGLDTLKRLVGKVLVKELSVDGKMFGEVSANANYVLAGDFIDFDVIVSQKQNGNRVAEELEAKGKYDYKAATFSGEVLFTDYNIDKIDRMFTDEVNEIKGELSGNLTLSGSFNHIDLEGSLSLKNAGAHVEYLNAYFNIPSAGLKVRPDFVGLDHVDVLDARGKKAFITGTGFHQNFRKWNFDVALEASDFQLLNTTKLDNSLYYGIGNISGDANASGYDDQLYFEMNIRPEKGSKIFIPLDDETEVNDQEFVEFISLEKDSVQVQDYSTSFDGIHLDLDIEANNNLEVAVVFDESAGDIMNVRGNGNINVEIDPYGDFQVRGKYIIEDGDYLFTLENVVNKKFNIRNGSSIFWFGDPYQGILDVTAEYNLNAPLREIVLIQNERYNRREKVVAILYLKNNLFKPDINFDIYLPNTDDLTRTQVKSVLRSQDEINRQVFSLLIFNRFSPPNARQLNTFSNASTTTTTELLSNQLSNWFSQISSDFDIGVNYSGNNLNDPTSTNPNAQLNNRQLALALTTQLFNERLTLSTNLGVDQTNFAGSTAGPNNRFISDFSLEYSLTKDGRFRLKAFNETAQGIYLANNFSNYIQGVGLYYRKDFRSFSEAWRNSTSFFRRSNKPEKQKAE